MKPRNRRTRAEQFMAERIQEEREKKGWSFRQLSNALRDLPEDTRLEIDPSALYKIETPTAEGKRRRITVDEAVSFAAVFEVSLSEWLLIPHSQTTIEGWRKFMGLVDELDKARVANTEYVWGINAVRKLVRDNPALREEIKEFQKSEAEKVRSRLKAWEERNHPNFDMKSKQRIKAEISDEWVWGNQTSAMLATHDALGRHDLTEDFWRVVAVANVTPVTDVTDSEEKREANE